jgi:putative ABC transport system permease protein
MRDIITDIRFGVRLLSRNPGFAAVALITLSLAIGANAAIFSVVNAVVIRPLPFRDPDRVVMAWWRAEEVKGGEHTPLCAADLLDWRSGSHVFEKVGAYGFDDFIYTGGATPERVSGVNATADFFDILGVKAALGRTFLPDEEKPGANRVVVVSNSFWRKYLASSPDAIGSAITLDDNTFTVVGVMPDEFRFVDPEIELFTTLELRPPTRRAPYFLTGLARLNAGADLKQGRADMATVARLISPDNPTPESAFNLQPLTTELVGPVQTRGMLVLLGAVAFVLLIGSVNIASLMVVRGAARQKEISIRIAIGAGRRRLIRQFLTEGLLLALGGGLMGLLLATWGIDALKTMDPGSIPRLSEANIDGRVLAWLAASCAASCIIFGLFPAIYLSRPNINEALKDAGRSYTETAGSRRLRGALAVTEIAVALVLSIGAGLLIRSFVKLSEVDIGVKPASILTAQLSLPEVSYPDPSKTIGFYKELLNRIRAIPGVASVAIGSGLPPNLRDYSDTFRIEGLVTGPNEPPPLADGLHVSADYFGVLGARLLEGRFFSKADTESAPQVVVVNETLVRQYFAGQDPIGKNIWWHSDKPRQIVGVIADIKYRQLDQEAEPAVYLPYLQAVSSHMYLTVKSALSDPLSLAPAIRGDVWSLDRDLPVADVKTLERNISESVAQPRFNTLLVALFSVMALLLAAVGIYGLIAYSVSHRTNEIGIRMAVGAQSRDVAKLVLKQAALHTILGMAIGLPGALAVTRVLRGLLFEIKPTDVATYVVISVLLSAIAMLAGYVPARRAAKIDPISALRHQ